MKFSLFQISFTELITLSDYTLMDFVWNGSWGFAQAYRVHHAKTIAKGMNKHYNKMYVKTVALNLNMM